MRWAEPGDERNGDETADACADQVREVHPAHRVSRAAEENGHDDPERDEAANKVKQMTPRRARFFTDARVP